MDTITNLQKADQLKKAVNYLEKNHNGSRLWELLSQYCRKNIHNVPNDSIAIARAHGRLEVYDMIDNLMSNDPKSISEFYYGPESKEEPNG